MAISVFWKRRRPVGGRGSDGALKAACHYCFVSGTFRRPVRRFMPATPVSLPWPCGDGVRLTRKCAGRNDLPPSIRSGRRRTDRHEVGRTGAVRRNHPSRPPCVPHRHARRAWSGIGGFKGDVHRAPNLSRVAGGKPLSADPGDEVLRLALTASAGPASPGRLLVYPKTGRGHCRHRGRRRGRWGMRFTARD